MRSILLALSVASFLSGMGLPSPLGAQEATVAGATAPAGGLEDLARPGILVEDSNGDGVPDRVVASLLLGDAPSAVEVSAAAEISSRLGFETMAADLPLRRGSDAPTVLVVGRGGLSASGLQAPAVHPTSLDAGEGAVAYQEEGGRRWVLVQGGDDAGLLAAARLFAGVLPHTGTLSSPSLDSLQASLVSALDSAGVPGTSFHTTQGRTLTGTPGLARVVLAWSGDTVVGSAERAALEALDPAVLTLGSAGSVEVRLPDGGGVRLDAPTRTGSPGPVADRPGSGSKESLDLSNLYTPDGLLGDSDSDEIPDRIEAILHPGTSGIAGLPELAGRLGLESTGLVVPLVEPAGSVQDAESGPVAVLVGTDNPLLARLADSGRVALGSLAAGEGLIQLVPDAFGSRTALAITGADAQGAERALDQVALTFPHLDARGRDRPTLDDVETGLWTALAGRSPAGQAALGLYKLDRITAELAGRDLTAARVLMSVEKADPRLRQHLESRAAALGAEDLTVVVDERDVQRAGVVRDETLDLPWEVDVFRERFRSAVVPTVEPGAAMTVEVRLSEPPELRAALADEARQTLLDAGADPDSTEVRVLSAFKQGFSWLHEVIQPRLAEMDLAGGLGRVSLEFRRNDPPEEWPQQAIQTPLRWLHEVFPIDEVWARDLGMELDDIEFRQVTDGPTYTVIATDTSGVEILRESFDPHWVLRPYFDRFDDYERVRVTTGWLRAERDGEVVADERIVTDPEAFWDHWQAEVLPAVYDYVMDRHDGLPRGGDADAPFFGELRVDLSMSEPDHRLGIDNEIHAPLDALHEEIYFGTLEFFDLLGRNSRGQELNFPGRVIPVMRPRTGEAPGGTVRFTGFATSRPAVVVAWEDASGESGEIRRDIPRIDVERPSVRTARVRDGVPGIARLGVRVRVDTDADMRDSLLQHAEPLDVDERMISAEQVEAVVRGIEELRDAGLYPSALAWPGLGTLEVRAEWSHEEDPDARRTVVLADNGTPEPLPDWRSLLPEGWSYQGERLVQWDTPIPPPEGHEILAKMAAAFPEATMYKAGESYLGKDIWALVLMPPVEATHWSRAKATTFKPTVVYSARQHANEVSSTSHVLRHAELLLTDPEERAKLDGVTVVVHPFTNPDGAQLAYDLYQLTPDYILHAGYLGALGMDATSGAGDVHPLYPESQVRGRLWERWLPDIFLNPHGYPSHQVVQLFSEYQGLVRRGRVTERNWGFNKGWFMPGFGYVDSPRFPRHRDAAFEIRDYITRGINAHPAVRDLNRRAYARYQRYGRDFQPDVYRIPLVDSVLIEMPLKGSDGEGGGYNPRVTIWSGTTEAPDETAYGDYMELVATAGLSWDQAITNYLWEGRHRVERSGATFFGGVSLKMDRPRPPKPEDGEEGGEGREGSGDDGRGRGGGPELHRH